MHHKDIDATPETVRLMKDAELPEYRGAVIVDLLACQPVVLVEGVDPAERELNVTAGRWKAAPRAQVPSADNDFQNDCGFTDVHRCTSICRSGTARNNSE